MKQPLCSLIVVNYNGLRHLESCFGALQQLAYPNDLVDLIMVDNGSEDRSVEYVRQTFPAVRTFVNTANNFAKALNLGVEMAKGQYIGFLNNDLTIDPRWLPEVLKPLEDQKAAGGAGGKILFKNGRINSVGHRRLPNFYFEDLGFNEEDRGQYDTLSEVEGLCWAAVIFRRECLKDVGPVDEDFVMYFEDVDFATRCRARGWKLLYIPTALAHHEYRGSSRGTTLTEYFCNRNRFIYLAKHSPHILPESIRTSQFFDKQEFDLLLDCMPITIKKLVQHHEPKTVKKVLSALCQELISIYGPPEVDKLLSRMQLILGHRKASVGIYDHALHTIGGGQKYAATIAAALQDEFEITFIANKPVQISDLESWYHLNLSRCRLKVIPLLFYEERMSQYIDSTLVTEEVKNPFETIAGESTKYDIFLNANMLEKVRPLAPVSIFICHFPDSLRSPYFAVDDYTFIIANSNYGSDWIKKRWGLAATGIIYPPVEMDGPRAEKENLILSVARFEIGGSKKQKDLIKAFTALLAAQPRLLNEWKLLLVGGTLPNNRYLEEVHKLARRSNGHIEVRVNVPATELRRLYATAKIFWHACGLNETDPHLIEHFGMTTGEAMQNFCAPVVINGGGQREIVEHGQSGFLFNTIQELCRYTLQLITDQNLLRRLQEGAFERSQRFTRARFEEQVRQFFDSIRREYSTLRLPDPKEVAENTRNSLFSRILGSRADPIQEGYSPAEQISHLSISSGDMKNDGDQRADADARYVMACDHYQSEERLISSGERDVANVILRDVTLRPEAAVLEISCGIGRLLRPFAHRVPKVYGVDVSGEMVNQARAWLMEFPNVQVYETSGADLKPIEDSSVDFCFALAVFQHVPLKSMVFKYIGEAFRVLRPGGIFWFQVDGLNDPSTQQMAGSRAGVLLTRDEIFTSLKSHGFDVHSERVADPQYFVITAKKPGQNELVRVVRRHWRLGAVEDLARRLGHPSPCDAAAAFVAGALPLQKFAENFILRSVSLAAEEFLFEVYRCVLDRRPDPEGMNGYSAALHDGVLSREGVIENFLHSSELSTMLTEEE